jgi:4-diphosphocytidyl-2-C-methyl-D-erythritol kinase
VTDSGGLAATGKALVASCPAKINLALRVLSRMEDGYHELDTVFQAVDLWDRLEIHPSTGWSLSCNRPEIPVDGSNLVIRAAELLAAEFGVKPQGELRLEKSIPSEAGLGGGSSDAAAALLLCARFWGLSPRPGLLSELGSRVGADVPFFLVGGTARGTGRGDRIEPIESLPETALLMGFPPYGVSTARVFRGLAERLTLPANGVSFSARFAHKWRTDKDFARAENDLESVVFESWPELRRFRDALLAAGATRAMLSGSGSTVFGAFPDPGRLVEAQRRLSEQFDEWRVVETRSIAGGIRIEPAN